MTYSSDQPTARATLDCAGVILVGGESARMGRSKATLPFGPEPMGVRVARIVAAVTRPVVVVAAAGQELPEFPGDIAVVRDRRRGLGPLEGLAVGLQAVADHAERAFVAACDLPLLTPAFIARMIELSAGFDACVPWIEGRHEPLAAVYRVGVLPEIEWLLRADLRRPAFLLDRIRTRRVSADELAAVDLDLAALTNVNDPAGYRAALAKAGFSPPDE